MRIAALYDIHGNLPALEAVLAELEELRPDRILIGGDAVAGPLPVPTLERLLALGDRATFIRGNADRVLAGEPGPDEAKWGELWERRRKWTVEQLGPTRRRILGGWPVTATLEIDGLGSTLFCHATPRSDEEIFTRLTPEARLAEIFAGVSESLVVCGHTHMQVEYRIGGTRVVNAGSVGMPYEGRPGAYWAWLGPDVEHRRTPYDLDEAAERIRAGGDPGAEEFIEKNLRNPPAPTEVSEIFEKMAREKARA